MIAKGALGVKFHEKICASLKKSVFTHSFLGVDGGQRIRGSYAKSSIA